MNIDKDNLLDSVLESLSKLDYIKPDEIPNIDLYMDQVTTFIDEHLSSSKRYEDDKVLTKTMINNYAKNNLLPSPVKKKYSKEHILMLIFIYYFKNILSINDIQSLLTPLADKYFNKSEGVNLEKIYSEVFSLERGEISYLKEDITEKFKKSQQTFADSADEAKDYLSLFSFICMLSFDEIGRASCRERV